MKAIKIAAFSLMMISITSCGHFGGKHCKDKAQCDRKAKTCKMKDKQCDRKGGEKACCKKKDEMKKK